VNRYLIELNQKNYLQGCPPNENAMQPVAEAGDDHATAHQSGVGRLLPQSMKLT
jgi:hypothetical protein